MNKEILINAGAGEIRVALVEDGKLQELFLERLIGLEFWHGFILHEPTPRLNRKIWPLHSLMSRERFRYRTGNESGPGSDITARPPRGQSRRRLRSAVSS